MDSSILIDIRKHSTVTSVYVVGYGWQILNYNKNVYILLNSILNSDKLFNVPVCYGKWEPCIILNEELLLTKKRPVLKCIYLGDMLTMFLAKFYDRQVINLNILPMKSTTITCGGVGILTIINSLIQQNILVLKDENK